MLQSERDALLTTMVAVVQVRTGFIWQSMAAFDVGQVALEYARECSESNPSSSYRVINLQSGRRIVLRKKAVRS